MPLDAGSVGGHCAGRVLVARVAFSTAPICHIADAALSDIAVYIKQTPAAASMAQLGAPVDLDRRAR
jgi:hypothetical protein